MAFYDRTSHLRQAGRARDNISQLIGDGGRAEAEAALKKGSIIGNMIAGAASTIGGVVDDSQRRKSLIDALKKGGASEEIIQAASSVSDTKDLLPMVALISNPKNTVSVGHSGGQQLIKDTFTGKERNIGTTWQNYASALKGKGGGTPTSTYLPADSNLLSIVEKNPALRDQAMQSGLLSVDKDGSPRTSDYKALQDLMAQGLADQQQKQLASQMPRIEAENKRINGNIKDFLKLQDELKKNKPLIFGDSNSFFKR